MSKKNYLQDSFNDNNEWNYCLNIMPIGNTLNFEITKDGIHKDEVCLSIEDCLKLKSIIENFKLSQEEKKPKSKSGRKKIYEGKSETLSIHVPSEKKEFIKSVVEAMLEPMKIK